MGKRSVHDRMMNNVNTVNYDGSSR